ncbi:MAG: MFS transporter [Candidatus Zixiibacteriota bacterium]|nr:MAG: MFS transporter [candidate division Zixibacteria bacterium]
MTPRTDSLWRRDIVGWSLYDFANTIYSMNIVSLYLKRYIVQDLGHDDRFFDIPFAVSMLLAAVLLPGLGALSDHSTKKKLFLFLFTVMCCFAVGLMALVPPPAVFVLIGLFIIANFSYEAGQPFYNALLYSVADGVKARFVSGVGVALGYVGSIGGMLLVLPFVTGDFYGFHLPLVTGWGKVGAFIPTAVLFFLFALPLFLWVREKPISKHTRVGFLQAYREVWDGIRLTKRYPGVLRFLIADYFFEDAAATVILNIGLYCSLVLSLSEGQITTFLTVSTASAVLGSFVFGALAQRLSLKHLMAGIAVGWVVSLCLFVVTDWMPVIWILGSVVGVLLGGLWTVSRPLLAELVPRDELGRFFGLFALSGRAAAVVGPLLWTIVVYYMRPDRYLGRLLAEWFGLSGHAAEVLPYKAGIAVLAIMMLIGVYIFRKVPTTSPQVSAGETAHG